MQNHIDATQTPYGGLPYWKSETPTTVAVGTTLLRYFPIARKLQTIETYAGRNGHRRFGSIAVIDLDDLAVSPDAQVFLRSILDDLAANSG